MGLGYNSQSSSTRFISPPSDSLLTRIYVHRITRLHLLQASHALLQALSVTMRHRKQYLQGSVLWSIAGHMRLTWDRPPLHPWIVAVKQMGLG